MQPYTKTNWVNDETNLSANNMNKIENQLETLTTNAISEAEDMGDLEDLDTTDKTSLVNAINEVASNGGSNSPIYEITLEHNYTYWDENNGYSLSANDKNSMANIINDAYEKGFRFINILVNSSGSAEGITLYSTSDDRFKNNLQTKSNRLWLFGVSVLNRFVNTGIPSIKAYQLVLSLNWNEDIANITSGTIYGSTKQFLPINNTVSYTPTADYNPATKKYVDDLVGNINTVLATLTTPSNNGGA